jgi:hypothetical protein
MNIQRAAEIQVLLEGVALPATRKELIEYAKQQDRDAARELEQLPDGEYDRLDAVGEALTGKAPQQREEPQLPRPESGKPPGGSNYLTTHGDPGAVRPSAPADNPPQKAIEQQTKTQQRQKQKQEA